jgi:drug/metabolite transporter (DMT)-like permease
MNGFVPRALPFVFVVLWASGFVVARLVRPYAEPVSFVTLRFVIAAISMGLIALASRAPWPRDARTWRDSLIAGSMIQGAYVAGTFWAIKHGLPAAIAALVSGLQPLLTGMLATPLLGEPVSARRWIGIATGFSGALLVLAPNLFGAGAIPLAAIAMAFAGMVAITFGTIWQKHTGARVDLRSGATIQLVGGLLVITPVMLATEHAHVTLNRDVLTGLAWSVLVLNITAGLLFLALIRRGAVAGVASLFYLCPPVTALMAYLLFGDALAPIQFVGMGLAAVGVAVANRA